MVNRWPTVAVIFGHCKTPFDLVYAFLVGEAVYQSPPAKPEAQALPIACFLFSASPVHSPWFDCPVRLARLTYCHLVTFQVFIFFLRFFARRR